MSRHVSPHATPRSRLTAAKEAIVSQDLFDRFSKCAVSILAVDAAKVTREARFKEDLEADSLDLVEFVMELESEFGVEVPEQELEGITTVGQAFDLIVAKTK